MKRLTDIIEGQVIHLNHEAFGSARKALVWNGRIPAHRPGVIVQVASTADIVHTVDFARRNGQKISIRGGGHHWCSPFLGDGGIVIDLSRLNQVITIDQDRKIAQVQPTVPNRDLARLLASHGLAFPVGHCSSVPLSGYLLGGGFGWNTGLWGFACFNVLEIEVVTADGQLITASEHENTDIFWAARGAGPGFFGVVTGYKLRLFDLPGEIRTSTLAFPLSRTAEVVPYLRETVCSLPANVEMIMVMANAPPPLQVHTDQVLIVSAVAFAQNPAEAERILAPIEGCTVGEPLLKQTQVPGSFETLFDLMDQTYRHGRRYAADTLWLSGDPAAHLVAAAESFKEVPGRESHFLAVMVPPPPAGAPPLPDAAFSMVAPLFLAGYSVWEEPTEDEANISWLRTAMNRFAPATAGHYVGEADLRTGPDKAAGCFAAPNWQRLCALKKRYDPNNLFRWFAENGE